MSGERQLTLPKPLAVIYGQARLGMSGVEQAHRLLDLFEATMQYMALAATARYVESGAHQQEIETHLRAGLQQPALGKWVQLVRILDRALTADGEPTFGCILNQKRNDLQHCSSLLRLLNPSSGGTKVRLTDVMNRLVSLRNDVAHKRLTPNELAQLAPQLQLALEELLGAMPFLSAWSLQLAHQVKPQRRGSEVWFKVFRGDGLPSPEQHTFPPGRAGPYEESLYLRGASYDELVELSPFVLAEAEDIFFLYGYDPAGKAQYHCPYSKVKQSQMDHALDEMRDKAGFLFEAPPIKLDMLKLPVEMAATDGVIALDEIEILVRHVLACKLAADESTARQVARQAAEQFAPGVRFEDGTEVLPLAADASDPAPAPTLPVIPATSTPQPEVVPPAKLQAPAPEAPPAQDRAAPDAPPQHSTLTRAASTFAPCRVRLSTTEHKMSDLNWPADGIGFIQRLGECIKPKVADGWPGGFPLKFGEPELDYDPEGPNYCVFSYKRSPRRWYTATVTQSNSDPSRAYVEIGWAADTNRAVNKLIKKVPDWYLPVGDYIIQPYLQDSSDDFNPGYTTAYLVDAATLSDESFIEECATLFLAFIEKIHGLGVR